MNESRMPLIRLDPIPNSASLGVISFPFGGIGLIPTNL